MDHQNLIANSDDCLSGKKVGFVHEDKDLKNPKDGGEEDSSLPLADILNSETS